MRWRELKVKLIGKLYTIYTPLNLIRLKLNGTKIGKNFKSRGLIRIQNPRGQLIIGDNVRINSVEWANPIGYSGQTNFQIMGNGVIEIEEDTGLSSVSITCTEKVHIGKNVLLGAGVKIYDTDFHPLSSKMRCAGKQNQSMVKSKPIVIGDGTFIAAGVIILKGSCIGKNCVIGAGSVVSGNIPDNQIWAGNPAKLIRNNE